MTHKENNGTPVQSQPERDNTVAGNEGGSVRTTVYDLLKKQPFRTVKVGQYTRIYKDSFEEWYSSQSHYKKVGVHTEVAECLKNE